MPCARLKEKTQSITMTNERLHSNHRMISILPLIPREFTGGLSDLYNREGAQHLWRSTCKVLKWLRHTMDCRVATKVSPRHDVLRPMTV